MAVLVRLPTPLLPFAGHAATVRVTAPATTVADVLERVRDVHPGVIARVLTEQRVLRPHVNVFVGEDNVRFGDGLATRVADGTEVTILAAVSGG